MLGAQLASAQARLSPDTTLLIAQSAGPLKTVEWVEDGTEHNHRLFIHNRTDHAVAIDSYVIEGCVGLLLTECREHSAPRVLAPHGTAVLGEVRLRGGPSLGLRYVYAVDLRDPETAVRWRADHSIGQ